jgi:hypothetical protein
MVSDTIQIPEAVLPLLSALSAGDLDAAATAVPEGALSAMPGAGAETDPRMITRDQRALRAALEPMLGGGRRLEILSLVAGERDVLLEGRTVGARSHTVLASIEFARGGIVRQLFYMCPLVDPSLTWGTAAPATADARAVVEEYFERLDVGDFEAAADCFSEDVLYSHPPYGPGQPRAEFRGRAELLAGLRRRRGPKPDREHHIVLSPQAGRECFLEGYTVDRPVGCTFISSISLDDEGRIRRYVAVLTEPVVPRV